MSRLKIAVNSGDHQLGNVNAPITLVEYGDFQCPHCGRAHPLLKRLLKEKGSDLNLVFRNFPLTEIHQYANVAAAAAEAAGKQGKFWEMHDLIFENQSELNDELLMRLAQELKLNMKKFVDDTESEEVQNKIEMDFEGGISSGVNGTPSFFVNGTKLSSYDETYQSLLNAVQPESKMK